MDRKIIDRIEELAHTNKTKTSIAKMISKEFDIPYTDNIRKKVSYHLNKNVDPGIAEVVKEVNVDAASVPHLWIKTPNASIFVKNAAYNNSGIDFDEIISKLVSKKPEKEKISIPNVSFIDRLIWTDVHVGMDTSRNKLALYDVQYDRDVLMSRIKEMADFVINNKQSDRLIIDDLGDYMDGWNGETVKGRHKLAQNMTNEEAFDAGLNAKILLTDILSQHYKYITCNNIYEDNHSGSFGYVVNSAFKYIVDHKYKNVEVINHEKFINHYIIGQHGFIITHGKDSRYLRFGFKPQLDPRGIDKITQYIRHNKDLSNCKYIEFSKGDSHQCLFDMCSSDEFDYFNYPSFAPSSEYIQVNFKKGRSGFVLQNIDLNSDRKNIRTYFF